MLLYFTSSVKHNQGLETQTMKVVNSLQRSSSWLLVAAATLFVNMLLSIQSASCFMTPDMVKDMMNAGRPLLMPHASQNNLGQVSTRCKADLAKVVAAETTELIQVIDAIGKPQAGFAVGNWAWLGHFDECMNITDFNYCLSYFKFSTSQISADSPLVPPLLWGLCVPESCSESDILNSLSELLAIIETPFDESAINASAVQCAKDPQAPYNTGFMVTMGLMVLLGSVMILGAFLDIALRSINYKPQTSSRQVIINRDTGTSRTSSLYRLVPETLEVEEGLRNDAGSLEQEQKLPSAGTLAWHQFLLSFALNRNLAKLLSTKTSEGSIGCLNGMRVISMMWVILGHTPTFIITNGLTGNLAFSFEWLSRFGFQAIANAFFSVDTFFFLSGLLVTLLTLNRMAQTGGSIPWFWFYFHRYWRLTPALGFTMLLWLFIKPHMGNGPMWPTVASDPICAKYWWVNLLYINNFYGEACIGWVWYLANDMQFFIISPFLLVLLYRVPKLGLMAIASLCIVSFITTAVLMVVYDLDPCLNGAMNADPNHTFSDVIYDKPYCRITPYLVGMALGYVLHKNRNNGIDMSPPVVAAGWAIATAIAMACVYGLYGDYHGHALTKAENAIYAAVSRFAWAVSLSWVVIACKYGYGGWINDFLSWDLWIPMSRLTYSAYLLHPMIITIYAFNMATNYFASLYIMSFEFAAMVVLAYSAALLLALAVEFPCGNLEKMFMPTVERKK